MKLDKNKTSRIHIV